MFDFTPLETFAVIVICVLVIVFYVRRFWFWFWKVTKLLSQFDVVAQTTTDTNEDIKDLSAKLEEIKQSLEELKTRS